VPIDPTPWSDLRLTEQIVDGNRNEVWRASLGGSPVSVRASRRSQQSLDWELDLLHLLEEAGFRVPTVMPAIDGSRHVSGVVVQRWLDGRAPATPGDWKLVAAELARLHEVTAGHWQRPGCCVVTELARQRRSLDADLDEMPRQVQGTVLAVFSEFTSEPTAVVHGDPAPSNIRISDDGIVGLLDWDESRVDVVWHDLSSLGTRVLNLADHDQAVRLSHAWEATNGWLVEPDYARRRLGKLDS